MHKLEEELRKTAKAINDAGYMLSMNPCNGYLFITNANINDDRSDILNMGMCTPFHGVYKQLNGKISIYRGKFQEWNNSILTLNIPINDKQIQFLLDCISFLEIHTQPMNKICEYNSIDFYGLR